MSRKINIFLPPYINTDEYGNEFVDENYFIIELPYPFQVDWNSDDSNFLPYISRYIDDIINHTPLSYVGRIYAASLVNINIKNNLLDDKRRSFYFIIPETTKESK